MSLSPSSESNETVPFPVQPEFRILASDGQLCANLGYQGDWVIEATLNSSKGDPNARIEGKILNLSRLIHRFKQQVSIYHL